MNKKDWFNSGFYLILILIAYTLMCFPTDLFAQLVVAIICAITGNLIYKKVVAPRISSEIRTGNRAHDNNTTITKNDQFFLSSSCSLAVLPMGLVFQKMAYWNNGMFWYWSGVIMAYLIWLMSIILLIRGFKNKNGHYSFWSILFILLTIASLVVGFLWVTFVVGMSG